MRNSRQFGPKFDEDRTPIRPPPENCWCGGKKCVSCVRKNTRVLLAMPGWYRARFRGRCWHCAGEFDHGTPVRVARECLLSGRWYVAQCCAFVSSAGYVLPMGGD